MRWTLPTIAYAVSVDHAHNLTNVFNDAGIPAAVILGDSKREERDKAIAGFRDGTIKVLVNVIVATEGFDLPDASCIAIARPTTSLALYLQMVGRGLRPKDDNCLILDLAANSVTHGLPEEDREWSLKPRAEQFSGSALLKELLEAEQQSIMGAADKRRNELNQLIGQRKAELTNEVELERLFESYLEDLPVGERPTSNLQKWRMFNDWENDLKSKLVKWKKELTELENQPIDKQAIFNSARNKVMHLLRRKAHDICLLPDSNGEGPAPPPPDRDHLRDYLIPVIKLIRKGKSHTEAFHTIAEKLEVTYGTVSARCTRDLGFSSVSEFIEHVESGRIIRIIKNQFQEDIGLIDRELGDLYI